MTTLRLADLGVVVHPKKEWPHVGLSYETKHVRPKYPIEFHTTQDRVDAELVEAKARQLRTGDVLLVEIVKLGGRIWIIDGHHALAAYIREALPPMLAVHGSGPYYVQPPKYARISRVRRGGVS